MTDKPEKGTFVMLISAITIYGPCRTPSNRTKKMIKLSTLTDIYSMNPPNPDIINLILEVNINEFDVHEVGRLWDAILKTQAVHPQRKSIIDAECTYHVINFIVMALAIRIFGSSLISPADDAGSNHQ